MADKLKMDAINALQHPLIAVRSGGNEWPIYDICVATGLVRIDVVGKLQSIEFAEIVGIIDGNGDSHDADDFYIEDEDTGNMHTDTDNEIAALIAQRQKLQAGFVTTQGDAEIVNQQITDINLRILQLQRKQAGRDAFSPRTDASKTAVENLLADAASADAKRFAADVEGIEEKIVWTTKDGKRWDRLEDAITHQRQQKIISAIMEGDGVPDWLVINSANIAGYDAELFAILEPFFRKGE